MDYYFKKPDGEIFQFINGKMVLNKCKEKFIECDKDGKEIKKETKKTTKKAGK